MVKKSFLIFAGLATLALPIFVFAVGGGGGGSVPSCSADVWSCGDWTTCSASGSQSRNCTMTYDCPGVDTPKPGETQTCTPQAPAPTPASSPTLQQPPSKVQSCTKDTWACSDWSSSCDVNGNEHRTCKISLDCPTAETPEPSLVKSCSKLQCGDKATIRDRIYCRLNLAPAGVARELQIKYLPEACRVEVGDERKECVDRYKSFQPCWNSKEGDQRFSCARNVLKLGPVVSDEVKTCKGKKGAEQVACKTDVKEKALYMIAFRFYDLETRAEELGNRGADVNAIADLEATIELKKQAFSNAKTMDERKQIILDVRAAWQDFIKKVKDQVKQ